MNDATTASKPKCRHCGKQLEGTRNGAYDPDTNERCRVNFYGGFVCSRHCDFRASLELEQEMPGHTYAQRKLGQLSQEAFDSNWEDES